jgi:hypothetical protein
LPSRHSADHQPKESITGVSARRQFTREEEDDFRETARFTLAGEPASKQAAVLQRGFRDTVETRRVGVVPRATRVREDGGEDEDEGIYWLGSGNAGPAG